MPVRARFLAFLRVSERPDPPPGAGDDLEVFRASRRFLYYNLLKWLPGQIAAALGLAVSLVLFSKMEQALLGSEAWSRFLEGLESADARIAPQIAFWISNSVWLFNIVEALAVVAFLFQLLWGGAMLKLSWELRWYMVGDEFLRIRHGLWKIQEKTMTVARIQNMTVRQGPFQKLLGIADLEVHTAGGGASAGETDESGEKKGLHIGHFRGLEDAAALRDRIRAQLIRHRGAGLGDAEEAEAGVGEPADDAELAAAARELLDETRALRRAFASGEAQPRLSSGFTTS